ncbi:DUF6268 family outer membrane beta-barrel protein [Ferrimonas lipolytica]|uniref:DUF6268 domain-containing protein n=1 Tax=Ferrimonas lipolytica TaxID=2724191 RepID=A0A6H1UDD4_9GAMM|nr:DUF6268 family outer membrane beta-barrel protein [Ferrimonas lipolytica]QIZ77095.1 hypothetical protein HER31_09535 [Ferrimonas lipolytica]
MRLNKWLVPLLLCASTVVQAQGRWELDLYGVVSGDADVEQGGEYNDDQYGLSGSYSMNWGRGRIAGVSLAADHRSIDLSGLPAVSVLRGIDGRDDYELSLFAIHPLSQNWGLFVSTGAEWATADGASSSDGFSYSAISIANYRGFEDLNIGIGVAYINGIVDVSTVPVATIDWQINEQWRLSNPFDKGFNGRAGLELSYQLDPKMSISIGGGFRSEQFAFEGGEIEQDLPLAFIRGRYQYRSGIELSLVAGYRLEGDLTVHSASEEIDTEIDGRWLAAVVVTFAD